MVKIMVSIANMGETIFKEYIYRCNDIHPAWSIVVQNSRQYICQSLSSTSRVHSSTSVITALHNDVIKGNIFRVTGPLCGKFTGHRWIPRTKASDAELWCFLWSVPWINGWVNNSEVGDLRRQRTHYDVIAMVRNKKLCLKRVRSRPAVLQLAVLSVRSALHAFAAHVCQRRHGLETLSALLTPCEREPK